MQYIDMAPALTTDATSLSVKTDGSLSGNKGGIRQQQDGDISASSSLHVTIGSEVGGDLSAAAAASMLTGEREGANENGGIGRVYLTSELFPLTPHYPLALPPSLSLSPPPLHPSSSFGDCHDYIYYPLSLPVPVRLSSDGRLEAPHSEPSSDEDDEFEDDEEGEPNTDTDPQPLSAVTPDDDKSISTPGKLPGK
jgi:hypothetical protein